MRPILTTLAVLACLTIPTQAQFVLHGVADPALVERLGAEITERSAHLDADILCEEPLRAWSDHQYAILRANRDRVLEKLRAMLADALTKEPDPNERFGRPFTVQRCLGVMAEVDPEEALDHVLALQDHADLQTALCFAIRGAELGAVRARPGLWDIVEGSLDHPDDHRRTVALSAAARIAPHRVRSQVLEALTPDREGQLGPWWLMLFETLTPDYAIDLLIEGPDPAHPRLMARLAGSDDPDVRRRAVAYLEERGEAHHGYWWEMKQLELEGDVAVPRLVKIMQDNRAKDYYRYLAMQVLIKLRGRDMPEVRQTVIEMLSQPEVEAETVSALGWCMRDTGDEQVADLMLRRAQDLRSKWGTWGFDTVIEASLVIGGRDCIERASAFYEEEASWPLRLRWAQRGWDDTTLVERIRSSGLAPTASLDRCEHYNHNATPMEVVVDLLVTAGAGVSFDAEADEFPVRHDRLIRQFTNGSAGLLRLEAVDQVEVIDPERPDDGHYRVRMVINGRYYEFQAFRGSDWYDTNAVLLAMNGILADLGFERRFYTFNMGQVLGFACATPEQASMIRDDFEIDLYDEPTAAPAQHAREFEERVIRSLADGE